MKTLIHPIKILLILALLAGILLPAGGVLAARSYDAFLSKTPVQSSLPQNGSGYIYKYLILRNTGGPIACGDTLFPVYVGKRTGDVKQDIKIALKSLFSTSKVSSGLYNPLANSKLKVSGVQYNPKNTQTTVRLAGRLVKPDNFCDIARARAVVWTTAQQFPEVRHAKITLGSALLGDLLAAKERAKP
jgi:hypothetical protein